MAQTRAELYQELLSEKQRVQELNVLSDDKELAEALKDLGEVTSTSKVAMWNLWLYITSFVDHIMSVLFDAHKAEVEALINSSKVHTSAWYAEKILEYQHGDNILLHPETYQPYYEVIDESKQVVKSVAVSGRGFALVKIRGENGKLPDTEAQGVEAYLREIQEPGAQLGVVNLDSDKLVLHAELYYEPEQDQTTIEANVQTAVETYIKNLPFDGTLQVSDLVDYVKDTDGVTDFYITILKARPDIGTVLEDVEARYYPSSGWMELETYQVTAIADV
ncbi:hypothetical protein MY04_4807 [Flammeovirga sp. MY04]|uniref:hypothetical protein n=1 Tax=Flammeovirga sp. MY04 TaxID=1191459 RepID=UPI000806127D|nr:hypothetical protein [Flammeovirga sp. MY04]ANQ49624.1 hypothetical protein MY04_2250 [Flammeovirga sp. MY04]ANQ52142.1 hypothetical protein MY04_4807 [Flammeovirga sp. MY04]